MTRPPAAAAPGEPIASQTTGHGVAVAAAPQVGGDAETRAIARFDGVARRLLAA